MHENAALDRLREALKARGLPGAAITPGASLRYLTGHPFHVSERLTALLVPVEGQPALVLPALEVSTWSEAAPFDAAVFPWDDADGPERAANAAVAHVGAGAYAVEPLVMRLMEAERLRAAGVELISDAALFRDLRLVKSPAEVALMRRAAEIGEAALEALLESLKPGMSEAGIAGKLSALLLEHGGEGISFGPIVLSGPNSALPHGVPGARVPQRGDFLLIDFGTSYRGYHCDITRTFVFGAEPDETMRRVYETVRAGNERGCAAVWPGVTAAEVHAAAQGHFDGPEWTEYFKHRTGHGLGLEIHEPPSIMAGNSDVLREGMVFTVEPGLYREGWGGVRIEDDVVVTAAGVEVLTKSGREMRVVGR